MHWTAGAGSEAELLLASAPHILPRPLADVTTAITLVFVLFTQSLSLSLSLSSPLSKASRYACPGPRSRSLSNATFDSAQPIPMVVRLFHRMSRNFSTARQLKHDCMLRETNKVGSYWWHSFLAISTGYCLFRTRQKCSFHKRDTRRA